VEAAKRLKRLVILSLLTCVGAWAQNTVAVRVGLNIPGPIFLVDGQAYTSPQIFQWTVGSNHQVYFLQTAEPDGSLSIHQYQQAPGVRYTFGGWSFTGQQTSQGQGPLVSVTVGPTLSDIVGQVIQEVALYVYFSGYTDATLACTGLPVANDPREGVVTVGSACFSAPATTWVVPGPISLSAASFPGFLFSHWLINGNVIPTQSFNYNVVMPASITTVFLKSKRARFRSNPLGLGLMVDQKLYKPGPLPSGPYSGDPYCPIDYSLLPISFPVGYTPLCVGDFDFPVGSRHVLSAPDIQTDAQGTSWIFTGFSNGLGQGGIYTADPDVYNPDIVYANFVRGVPSTVSTSPAGMSVVVDGQGDSVGSTRIWTAGQAHHVVAPATQTDAAGHAWKFVGWSNQGSADQTYTVPTGVLAVTLTANYELAGNLQVDSVPSGLPFRVDGVVCTTPCVISDKPVGSQVQVVATVSVSPDAFRRYDFKSWNTASTSNSLLITVADQVQIFTAAYQGFYKLSMGTQPANQGVFTLNPPAVGGFFAEGTPVSITVAPQNGFKFGQWSGDASGSDVTTSVVMAAPRSVIAVMDGVPFLTGVKNAAGDTPSGTVGPGSDISIFGGNLSAATDVAPANPPVFIIDDVWVTVQNNPLPLLFVSPQQINAQLSSSVLGGPYTLTVHRKGQPDVSRDFTVRLHSPGLFQWYPTQGTPTIAAFHEDGSMLTAANPAARNETISIYGTGFGLYDRPLVDGYPTPGSGDWNLLDPVTVTVGGQTYTPVSARAAGGLIGMVVVRVKLTGTVPSGLIDMKVTVGNEDSNTTKLPVK
jgi:uncharacterized protein (TIGR03437 family)